MGILVPCPGCGRTLDAPAEAVGRAVKCTACGREFALPAGGVAGQPPPPPPGYGPGQMPPGQAPPGGYRPVAQVAYQPVYGDEIYDLGFNLQAVDPALLNYWRSWRPTQFSVAGAVLLDIFTCGLFGLIYYGLKFDDLPKASRNDFGAGKGIGFMFIPYFGIYWQFKYWWGLCDRINLQLRLRQQPYLLLPRGLATTICVLLCCSIIPYVGVLPALAAFVCREVMIAKMQKAINALAMQAAPPAFAVPPAGQAQ